MVVPRVVDENCQKKKTRKQEEDEEKEEEQGKEVAGGVGVGPEGTRVVSGGVGGGRV
jgi:hypothetical protein